jgi:valyl-tRNA synthetase
MEIPSKYNPREVEGKIYQLWLNKELFNAEVNRDKKPFCILIPPPNITGILHIGHALNNTIQDVLIRFKRMQGYESLWMPGTDHAGIATQNVVEKELMRNGLTKESIGRDEFTKRLWKWTEKYGSTILQQLKKLGASCDWRRSRFTMDEAYSETVKEVFVRLYEAGLIYRGNYIINWCPRCKTALSDEESPHKKIDGWLYYIRYPVKDKKTYIVVATTRPETMLGDTAVAINPKDEKHQWLKKTKVILPIMERELKVIEDELIDPEFGTGIVKVTPAHDPIDFIIAKKHNLDFINIMNPDATLNKNAKEYATMDRFEARKAILERLERENLIEKKEPYKISAGHCYRCYTIVEPRLSLQWFVKMKPLAKEAIRVVEEGKINFYPLRWKKTYLYWMNNIEDWCISRQIWWGHPLPVYYCKDCQKDSRQSSGSNSHLGKERGVIVSRAKIEKCPYCGSGEIIKETDVLDTWFSSWLWPFATFYWPFSKINSEISAIKGADKHKSELKYFYPTSVLVTASEILFFWVARMIMASLKFMGEIPFKDIFIHGTVRDERGLKMSKSLGNIIDPLQIIDKFGADALRFSLMLLAGSGSDIYLSESKFLVGRNFCNKIWNATRFILSKVKEKNLNIDDLVLKELGSIDRWLLEELNQTIEEVTIHLEKYQLNEAIKEIYDFFWHTFCDWYIEIVKDNLDIYRAKVLIYVLINSIKLLHPFIPFITEEIFQLIKNYLSVFLEKYLIISSWPSRYKMEIDEEMVKIKDIIDTIKAIRSIKIDLGVSAKKVKLEVSSKNHKDLWLTNTSWIKRLAKLESIDLKGTLERTIYKNKLGEFNLNIDNFDTANFISSLEKKIKKITLVLEKTKNRINNDDFLKKAPPEKVEEEKMKSQELSNQIKRLKELKNAFE